MSTIKEPSTLSISVEELTALRAKIQALPKAELHRHLEGSIRLSTVKFYYCVNTLGLSPEVVTDVFSQRGTLNAPGTAVFLNAACAPAERDAVSSLLTVDMSVPANAAQQGVPAEDELVKVVVGRACNFAPEPTLVDFLNKFVNIQNLFSSAEIVEQITFEVVEDCALINTRIVELRYSPAYMAGGHGLSYDVIHQAILAGVKRAQAKYPIAVGLIGIMERQMTPEVVGKVCDFVIANKDTFVGIDLANDELSHDSLNFKDFFLKAADAGVNVTVHSGEVPVDEAPQWVWNSIEQLRAQRIGHGFNIIRDPAAVAKAAARGTVFEVCPSSNYLCQGVASVAEHPLAKLVAGGLRCTLNTDDPGMFGVDLNNEVEIAITVLGLSMETVEAMMRTARDASFVSEEEKARVWPSTA